MSDLVLHYAPDNASLCVRLALEAAHLRFDTRLVDRAAQGQKSPEFRALNPNGLIPVLETPDGPLFETAAILLWLAERAPALMPQQGPTRAMAHKWLIWMANTLHPTLRMLFYPTQFIAPEHAADLSIRTVERLCEQLQILNDGVAGAPWIGGSAPSILDCYLCPMLRWIQLYPKDAPRRPHLPDYPALLAIAASCSMPTAGSAFSPSMPYACPRSPSAG